MHCAVLSGSRGMPPCSALVGAVVTGHTRSQRQTRLGADTNDHARTGRRRTDAQESGDVDQQVRCGGSERTRQDACCMDSLVVQRRSYLPLLFCLLLLTLTASDASASQICCLRRWDLAERGGVASWTGSAGSGPSIHAGGTNARTRRISPRNAPSSHPLPCSVPSPLQLASNSPNSLIWSISALASPFCAHSPVALHSPPLLRRGLPAADEQPKPTRGRSAGGLALLRACLSCDAHPFGMLTLADLSRILAVRREWSAVVRSMAPISALLECVPSRLIRVRNDVRPLPPIARVVSSPLLRHLGAVHIAHTSAGWNPLSNASLALLAQHAPNLTSLWCTVELTPNEPLSLPAKLQSLQLRLDGEYTDASINSVLTTLAALPSLSRLLLELSDVDRVSSLDLSLLAACPSLSDLMLAAVRNFLQFTEAQADQVRSSLGHLQRFSVLCMTSDNLARLLQPPVTARWRDVGPVFADARTGELLLRLPALTTLVLSYRAETAHVDFLSQLTQLTALELYCSKRKQGAWPISADALLASLVRCVGLTELTLLCGFHSTHWSAMLAKLTRISKLTISGGELESLRCFEAGPITQSLVELTMHDLELPKDEVSHLYGLRRLRTLRLDDCFFARLDDATVDSLSPPSPLLPALTELFDQWRDPRQWNYRQRHGPSFEWMQERRTQ